MDLLYEKYHSVPKLQKRILTSKNFTYRNLFGVLDKHLKFNKVILDIGCGVGTTDFYIASKGNVVTGLDISENAISIAKQNANLLGVANNTKFLVGKFPNSKIVGDYNLVMMLEVVEHLPNDKEAIKECYRILRKDGILILSTRSKNEILYKLGFEKKHDRTVGHLRRYSVQDLKKIITNSGFKVLEIRKTEGLLRDSMFVFPVFGNPIVRVANKFGFFSDLLTLLDDVFLKFFGESQIYIVAKK